VQLTATGTVAGTVQVQGSNDGVDFGDDGAPITLISGTTINNFPDRGYAWVQLVFTAASGSGTLTAYIAGKLT
jgi:hypothetical protein